jgi:ferredoxin
VRGGLTRGLARARLLLMRLYVPAGIRRQGIEELLSRTAAAFGKEVPPASGRSAGARLRDLAGASCSWAEAAIAEGRDLQAIDARLSRSALHLGRVYRARLGISSTADALAAARAIYRGIGIDLRGDARSGEIVVRRCMFSRCYSPGVCRLISALDRGLLAGLTAGGSLRFTARITEGCDRCRAVLTPAGGQLPKAVVVGSGAGGAAVARELQGAYQVTILEAGKEFSPLSMPLRVMERLRRWRLLPDPRVISLAFPGMKVRRAGSGMYLVNGRGTGGTTTLSAGNALRLDGSLAAMGIDLDAEFEELAREVPRETGHARTWTAATRQLFEACASLGLSPRPTPKMIDFGRCRRCGRCVLGCPTGAKWDSRRFLDEAVRAGATLETGVTVRRVVVRGGKAAGVVARRRGRSFFVPADLVVLAAGGLDTPVILGRSGVACEPRLFVDPVLCVAAPWQASGQLRETPMPFVVQEPGYIISPYFDYVSWLFDRRWRMPADGMLGLMIKLADSEAGSLPTGGRGRIRKTLTDRDRSRLAEAVETCTRILEAVGVDRRTVFLGTLNAGHPGGMLPLAPADAATLHPGRLPANLYVADASLLPSSLGNPPILTIMALAMKIGRLCVRQSGAQRGQGHEAPGRPAGAASRPSAEALEAAV